MATTSLMTAEDLARMPDDGYRYELIRGVLQQMPPTGGGHHVVSGRLISYLNQYLDPRDLGSAGGEGGFILERDPDTVFGPDVAVILAEQFPMIPKRGYMRFPPPLVAEVISPKNRLHEIEEKVQTYLRAGVKLIWVVDTDRKTIRVRPPEGADELLTEADELTGGDLFPEFRVAVARIFRWLI